MSKGAYRRTRPMTARTGERSLRTIRPCPIRARSAIMNSLENVCVLNS